MPLSQNVVFDGTPPSDAEFDHPPGCFIARLLRESLSSAGWRSAQIENWNDRGWRILCSLDTSSLQIGFMRLGNGQWMLQISPEDIPGLVGRLLGKRPSADPSQCQALAEAVHGELSSSDLFSGFAWCWDGYPGDQETTERPIAYDKDN